MNKQNANDHLANERTLLAWVRTSVGIMAFGFVVVKFSLFVRAGERLMGVAPNELPHPGNSGPIGVVLVATGTISLLLATMRYRTNHREIDSGNFKQSSVVLYIIVSLIVAISVMLIVYLISGMPQV